MRTVTTAVYSYSELSEKAQQAARDNLYRVDQGQLGLWEAESMCEWATDAGALLGIDIEKDSWQWDAYRREACCKGIYSYLNNCAKKVRAEFGDERIHELADRLVEAQRKHNFKGEAGLQYANNGFNDLGQAIYVLDRNGDDVSDDDIEQILREFVQWAAFTIADAYDGAYSEDRLAEHFEANEYEFEEDGTII